MKQKIKLAAITLFMVFNIFCNLEVNTTDPQSSVNVVASKKDSLCICEYQSQQIPNRIFKISEAWMENVWFNKVSKGRKIKAKTKEMQLSLKLSDFQNREFQENKYIIKWVMKDKKNNFFGQSNGVYVLFMENQKIQDSINISICKLNQNGTATDVCNFYLTKKN